MGDRTESMAQGLDGLLDVMLLRTTESLAYFSLSVGVLPQLEELLNVGITSRTSELNTEMDLGFLRQSIHDIRGVLSDAEGYRDKHRYIRHDARTCNKGAKTDIVDPMSPDDGIFIDILDLGERLRRDQHGNLQIAAFCQHVENSSGDIDYSYSKEQPSQDYTRKVHSFIRREQNANRMRRNRKHDSQSPTRVAPLKGNHELSILFGFEAEGKSGYVIRAEDTNITPRLPINLYVVGAHGVTRFPNLVLDYVTNYQATMYQQGLDTISIIRRGFNF